jgi:hypothetical protein
MTTLRTFSSTAVLLLAALLTACATPDTRIERDPATYARLSPEDQAKVKAGNVGVGFDEASVKLALGEPDRVIERESTDGNGKVWVYYAPVPGFATPFGCSGFYPYSRWYNAAYVCSPGYTEYIENARVTFKDGKVVAVERSKP